MSLLSSSQAILRYQVEQKDDASVLEMIRTGLKVHAMPTMPGETMELVTGWVPYEEPYSSDFEKNTFQYGNLFLFSLRVDKKAVPAKVLKQQVAIKISEKLKETGREFLSRTEKVEIKEMVLDVLMRKLPFTPTVYELAWDYEENVVYFFSAQKAANELLETLFMKTFKRRIFRLFPYTVASRNMDERKEDRFQELTPTKIGA